MGTVLTGEVASCWDARVISVIYSFDFISARVQTVSLSVPIGASPIDTSILQASLCHSRTLFRGHVISWSLRNCRLKKYCEMFHMDGERQSRRENRALVCAGCFCIKLNNIIIAYLKCNCKN